MHHYICAILASVSKAPLLLPSQCLTDTQFVPPYAVFLFVSARTKQMRNVTKASTAATAAAAGESSRNSRKNVYETRPSRNFYPNSTFPFVIDEHQRQCLSDQTRFLSLSLLVCNRINCPSPSAPCILLLFCVHACVRAWCVRQHLYIFCTMSV